MLLAILTFRTLCYLKGALGLGLLYKLIPLYVTGFSDADWAGSLSNGQSTSGYCTFVTGNLITWRNKMQNVVAHSSVEAEYRAMAYTASKMLWVPSLLRDFGVDIPIPMQRYCDNQTTIFIANNPVFHTYSYAEISYQTY